MMETESGSFEMILGFKGQRDYLHGTDMYIATTMAVREQLGEESWVNSMVFRGVAKTACEVILGNECRANQKAIRAIFSASKGSQKICGSICETGKPIEKRFPFDENLILRTTSIIEQAIVQESRAGFTSIEEIVVMTKQLHNTLLPLESGKWLFSQLDLMERLSDDESVRYTIRLRQNLARRMTVSDIEQDKKLIGKIRFTAIEI